MYYKALNTENFSSELIDAVKEMGLKPSLSDVDKFIKFINKKYNINEKCTIELNESGSYNSGCYVDYLKKIIFYKRISLITALHEIRHYVQFNTDLKKHVNTYELREIDARCWSASLFYASFPEEYISFSKTNNIKYI